LHFNPKQHLSGDGQNAVFSDQKRELKIVQTIFLIWEQHGLN
jgi:hypothetical protein